MAFQSQTLGAGVLSTDDALSNGLQCPIRGFRFTVDFGIGITSFKSVTGFSARVSETTYREGGFGTLTVRKLPGLAEYDDLVLEKGMYKSPDLYNWFNKFLNGEELNPVDPVTITAYDANKTSIAVWQVRYAWPKEYRSTDLNADDSSIIIESLTLAHEGIVRLSEEGAPAAT